MAPHERQRVFLGAIGLAAVLATAWSVHWMLKQRESARAASEELAACRQLALSIESLRSAPKVATTEDLGSRELGAKIEAASRQAHFSGSPIEGVFPQSARRVGESPYVQKPVAMTLRGATLEQLATFLYYLTEGSALTVRDLRLRTPHGDVARNVWDAEATLACLIYEPTKKSVRGK